MQCSLVFCILAACLSSSIAQKLHFGECPNVPVKDPFDISKYTGKWYEIEKIPTVFQDGRKCSNAVYEDKGDYISVVNTGVIISTGEESSIEGKATIPDKNVPAKLKVDFNTPAKGNYWILDTDYENYSLVYSCFGVNRLFKAEYVWILGREKTLDDTYKQRLYKILDDNKIDRKALKPSIQDC